MLLPAKPSSYSFMITSSLKKILALFGIGVTPVQKRHLGNGKALHTIRVGNYDLKLNKSHSLPFNIKNYPDYNKNLPRLVRFLNQSYPGLSVIDVGANVGDTVLFIKEKANVPVICFEGDPYYSHLLKRNTAPFNDVTIFDFFLSDQDETIRVGFNIDQGTLSVKEEEGGKTVNLRSIDSIVSEKPQVFEKTKVLKVDTDGFDMKILRGAWHLMETNAPVLFFEYDRKFLHQQDEQGIDMLEKLADKGYHRLFFYDNFGRFITSLTVADMKAVQSMHDYIAGYKAPFPFYDIAFFHKNDETLALKFFEEEQHYTSITS